jgi:predicted RNA-binding Zn ribbon-like protein
VATERTAPDLPDPPFPSGEPYWYFKGGRPAMDFVNTRRERWNRDVECLVSPGDLGAWLLRAGLLPGPMPVRGAVLEEAVALREAIDACVRAAVAGEAPPAAAVSLIDDHLVNAGARPQLTLAGALPVLGERAAADSPRRALGMLAFDAARMLGTAERERIRICASDTCSARFFDRSPAAVRRWCSMNACGNREKAQRHRSRRREAAGGPTASREAVGGPDPRSL